MPLVKDAPQTEALVRLLGRDERKRQIAALDDVCSV